MWVMLSDAFLSIVAHPKRKDLLLVRARAAGDIKLVFPNARVRHTPKRDYAYRADLPRETVALAMAHEARRIDYPNFKNSVREESRHDAYATVWLTMLRWGRGAFMRWGETG